jgi:hypothetical protein
LEIHIHIRWQRWRRYSEQCDSLWYHLRWSAPSRGWRSGGFDPRVWISKVAICCLFSSVVFKHQRIGSTCPCPGRRFYTRFRRIGRGHKSKYARRCGDPVYSPTASGSCGVKSFL